MRFPLRASVMGRDDGGDVYNLHEYEQRVVSNYAVAQEQRAGNKPD